MEPKRNTAGNMFGREDAIKELKCVNPPLGCGRAIEASELEHWNQLTLREYRQSGWCKKCQKVVFGTCPENTKTGVECTHQGLPGEEECRCTCSTPCCQADIGVGIITCGSQHCPVHEGE